MGEQGKQQEIPTFARTSTGIRCMGETCWAEGETKEEAERAWRGMKMRATHLNGLLGSLMARTIEITKEVETT